MDAELLLLIPLFFLVATVYSSAGFGGGSSYLAIMALFPMEYTSIRIIALICNITVVSGSVYLYHRHRLIPFGKLLPLVLLSVPLAFLGGTFEISERSFYIMLGAVLVIASFLMMIRNDNKIRRLPPYSNGIIGGSIGFLSGMVGIGGGIFLSPVLYLTRWHVAKSIAATTAFYILVNSIAGLAGQLTTLKIHINFPLIISLVLAVFIGGQIGSRLTISRIQPLWIKRISAVLILIVGIRILIQYANA